MYLKRCPFCYNIPINYWDHGEFIIKCGVCESKGLNISIKGNDMNKVQKIWNDREFDKILLEDPENTLKSIDMFKNGITSSNVTPRLYKLEELSKKFDPFDLTKEDYGYIIMPNGDIIKCLDSHPEVILEYLDIDTDNREFDYINFCIENNIIRICSHDNCIMVVLPNKFNKKQIDNTISVISKDEFKISNDFCIFRGKEEKLFNFSNLNELILFLDKVK